MGGGCCARGAVRRAGRAPTSGRRVHIDAGGPAAFVKEQKEARWRPCRSGERGARLCVLDVGKAEGRGRGQSGFPAPAAFPTVPPHPHGVCRGVASRRAAGCRLGVGAAAAPPTWLTDRGGGGRRGPPAAPSPRGRPPTLPRRPSPRLCLRGGGGGDGDGGGSPPPPSSAAGLPRSPLRRAPGGAAPRGDRPFTAPPLPASRAAPAQSAAGGPGRRRRRAPALCRSPAPGGHKGGRSPGETGRGGGGAAWLAEFGAGEGGQERNPVLGGEGEVRAGGGGALVARPSFFYAIYTRVLSALLNPAVGATCTMWPREGGKKKKKKLLSRACSPKMTLSARSDLFPAR